jgi:hypothetical protein
MLKGKVLGLVLSSLLSVGANEVETTKIETPKKEVIVQENEQKEEINEVVNRYAEYEKLEEEKEKRYRELTRYEIANNPNFEIQYKELKKIYSEYLDHWCSVVGRNTGRTLPKGNLDRASENIGNEYCEKLKNYETFEGGILEQYKASLQMSIEWDSYGYSEIENIIDEELDNN